MIQKRRMVRLSLKWYSYRKTELLNKQVRYEFQYNENGKVSEKKAFRWDRTNDEWVPFYQITYQYDDRSGEIKTNYGMWDKKKKNFSLNVQNMIIPSTNYEEIFS